MCCIYKVSKPFFLSPIDQVYLYDVRILNPWYGVMIFIFIYVCQSISETVYLQIIMSLPSHMQSQDQMKENLVYNFVLLS